MDMVLDGSYLPQMEKIFEACKVIRRAKIRNSELKVRRK